MLQLIIAFPWCTFLHQFCSAFPFYYFANIFFFTKKKNGRSPEFFDLCKKHSLIIFLNKRITWNK